jgi:hypothetical protein
MLSKKITERLLKQILISFFSSAFSFIVVQRIRCVPRNCLVQRLVEPALRTVPELLQASLSQYRLSVPASPIPLVPVESLGLLSAAAQNGQVGRTSSCRKPKTRFRCRGNILHVQTHGLLWSPYLGPLSLFIIKR